MVYRSLLLMMLASFALADTGYKDTIRVKESDGSPSCMAGEMIFNSGQLTCSGNKATLNITGGGGGASSLAVTIGVARSSPTSDVMFNANQFSGSVSGSSMTVTLQASSVTLQGQNVIKLGTTLQAGATFYTSSGTVNTFNIGTSIRWPDGTIQISSPVAGGGGTPASPVNSVQFNNAGSFGGDSDFMFYGDSVTVNSSLLYMPANNVYLGVDTGGPVPPTGSLQNTCVGGTACGDLTTAQKNTCIGQFTCDRLTTGYSNTAVGQGTAADVITGVRNVCIGGGNDSWQTCQSILYGSSNTMVGVSAGSLSAGDSDSANTFLGFQAGQGDTGGPVSNSICIGAYCTVAGSNQARIGGRGAYDVTLDVSTMTISSATITRLNFPDATFQTSAGLTSPGNATWTNTYGMSLSTVAITTLTPGRVAYVGTGDQIVDSSLLTFDGSGYGSLNIGGGSTLTSVGLNIDNGGAGGTPMIALNSSGGTTAEYMGFYLDNASVGNFGIFNSGGNYRWRLAAATDLMTLDATPILSIPGASADIQVNSVSVCLENGTNCPVASGGASSLAVFEDTVNVSSPTAILKFDGGPFNVTLPASGTGYVQLDASSVTLQGQNVIKLGSTLQSGAVFHVSSGSVNTLNITDAGYIKSLSPSTTATLDLTLGDLNKGLVIKTGEETAAGIPYIQLNESMVKMKQAVVGPAVYANFQMCNGNDCNYLYSVDPSYSSPSPGWYFNNDPQSAWGMYVGSSSTTIKSPSINLNGWTKLTSSMSITGAGGLTLTYGLSAATATFTTDLQIPNGANPTVDATGEVAFDSTDGVLVLYDGSATNVVGYSTHSFHVAISSGLGWNGVSIPIWRAPTDMAVTITKIMAESLPSGTTVLYQLDETAFGATASAGTDVFSVAYSTANNTGVTTTSFSNAGIAAESSLVLNTPSAGASSGTPSDIVITVYYKRDRE